MSPENQQPDGSQGIKDLINTSAHPEGVLDDFTTPLSEAAPKIEKRGIPKDVSKINPTTHEVEYTPFDTEQVAPEQPGTDQLISSPDSTSVSQPVEVASGPATVETKRNKKKLAAVIASVVGAVGIGGFGVAKAMDNSNEATPVPTTPTASAPAVPGATETGSATNENGGAGVEQQPEALVGIANYTLEGANILAPKELAEQATEPILASEHTPEEAAKLYFQYFNIYLLSGEINPNGVGMTPESLELGTRIEQNLDGTPEMQQANGVDYTKLRELRTSLAGAFGYINGLGVTPKEGGAAATYHREYTINDYVQRDETTFDFSVTSTTYSNIQEKDPEWVIDLNPTPEKLTLQIVNGRYIGQGFHEIG